MVKKEKNQKYCQNLSTFCQHNIKILQKLVSWLQKSNGFDLGSISIILHMDEQTDQYNANTTVLKRFI